MPKRFVASCCVVLGSLLGLGATLSAQTSQWEQLPSPPDLPKPDRSGMAAVNGIKIWYAVFGQGSPIIMVHGEAGSSKYWGLQILVLARQYEVIVLDSRGHGRSTRNSEPITYHLMASDVLAVTDRIKRRIISCAQLGSRTLERTRTNQEVYYQPTGAKTQ
jgi:hypothetical protein